MKKILFGIICLFLSITLVEAKEYCTVVSGNGKDIGSEIACGDEHFYVIDNDGTNTKMLAKYNLYVGANYDKITFDINDTYIRYELCDSSEDNCKCTHRSGNVFDFVCSEKTYFFEGQETSGYNEWANKIEEKYNIDNLNSIVNNVFTKEVISEIFTIGNKSYKKGAYKLYPTTYITSDDKEYALQNELALGVTGDKGNANYPIYATLILFPSYNYDEYDTTENYENFENGYLNFEFKDNSYIKNYLNSYKTNLINMGYEASNVDIINMKELNEIVKNISSNNLPLSDWYDLSKGSESIQIDGFYSDFKLGDLKEYISDEYSWLWSTSYWTKTFVGNEKTGYYDSNGNLQEPEQQVYFVSSSGEICYTYSECDGIPRAGIRPVVTIANKDISYIIETKTDGNGTVKASKSTSNGGEEITFEIMPNKGYVLSEVKVTDSEGNIVTFTDYKFTMPNANVLIEATFIPTNPNTKTFLTIIPIIVFIVSAIVYFKTKTKTFNY